MQTFSPPRRIATRAACTLVALSALQIGCTSSSSVPLAAPSVELISHAGFIELQDERGRRTPVAADSRVYFRLRDGTTSSAVRAGALCRSAVGLGVRHPTYGCSDAHPLARFDQIETVEVETWDRAGTTVLVAGAAVVVVGVIVIIAMSVGGKNKKKNKTEAQSEARASAGSSRSPSSASSSGTDSRLIVPALRVGDAMARQAAYDDATAVPRTGPGAVFAAADRRRASVQVLLDTDISASVLSPRDSLATGGRIGARLGNFFDVSLGMRAVAGEGRTTRPVPVVGVGFHGPLPRAPWFAFAVGGEVGATTAIDFYATARLGVRVAPFTRFWLTLYPLHPTYTGWSNGGGDRWVAASTFEMGYAF